MTRRTGAGLETARCPALPLSRRAFLAATTGGAALALSGCSIGAEQLFSGGASGKTVTVAIVSNSQMQDAISLSYLFERLHPDIHLKFVSLPENEARAKITADVSTQGGRPPDAIMHAAQGHGQIVVGIRPEHLSVGEGQLETQVDLVEDLGSVFYATCARNEAELAGGGPAAPGDARRLLPSRALVHRAPAA
jgi:hypothetical protein